MKLDKKDIIIIFVFLLLVLASFYKFLGAQEMLGYKDLSRYFYPLRHLMTEQVNSGILPLWNPYIFCGFPLLAALQVGFFYPFTLIHYILPFNLAFNYFTIIHYFIAASSMYFLMRHYKFSRPAAALAGIVFAFSGYLLSVSNMNTSLTSVVWLPLVLMFWDRVITSPPDSLSANIFALILFLCLMFLGGEPTIFYVTGWLLLFYAVFLSKDILRNLKILALAFVIAGLLLSVQLFPFMELLLQSDRTQMADFNLTAMRSFPPREIINFLLPFFFGNQLRPGNYSEKLLGAGIQDWLLSPYVGFFVLFFFAVSLFRKDKKRYFIFGAGLVALLLAFGRYTPLYLILYKFVPGISLVRYPVKYLFLATFSLAYLSAAGFEDIIRYKKEKKLNGAITAMFISFVIFAASAAVIHLFGLKIFAFLRDTFPKDLPNFFVFELFETFSFNAASLINLSAFIFAAFLFLLAAQKRKLSDDIFSFFFIMIVFIDIASVNLPLAVPLSPGIFNHDSPNIKILKGDKGLFRHYYSLKLENTNRLIYGPNYNEALLDNRDKLAANRLVPDRLSDTFGYESIELMDFRKFALKIGRDIPPKILNMINAKYAMLENPVKLPAFKLLKHSTYYYGQVFFYENQYVLPRAYIVHSAKIVKDKDRMLNEILKPNFEPEKEIILGEMVKVEKREGQDKVRITKYRSDVIEMEIEAGGRGILFLSDTYYPGWRAYIDGRETKIYRANYVFRAISVPSGKYQVKFVFDPFSLKLGFFVSALTFCGIIASSFFCHR